MAYKKIKLDWVQNTNTIKITQGYHGAFQNNKAMDFTEEAIIAPFDGEITLTKDRGIQQYFHYEIQEIRENAYIQFVHGRPVRMGKFKKGEIIGYCNWHHWHIAINVSSTWMPIMNYIHRNKELALIGNPWSTPYNQWSFYGNDFLQVSVPTTPANPQPTQRTYTVKSGDSLWLIAQKELGSGTRWSEIYNLNKDKIKNPDLIQPNWVLKLPN